MDYESNPALFVVILKPKLSLSYLIFTLSHQTGLMMLINIGILVLAEQKALSRIIHTENGLQLKKPLKPKAACENVTALLVVIRRPKLSPNYLIFTLSLQTGHMMLINIGTHVLAGQKTLPRIMPTENGLQRKKLLKPKAVCENNPALFAVIRRLKLSPNYHMCTLSLQTGFMMIIIIGRPVHAE